MKRKLTALTMAAVLAFSLAGCGENANANNPNVTTAAGTQASGESAGETQAAGSTEGKVLTVAFAEGGKTLNPSQATDSTSAIFINAAYDQLVTYGSTTNADGYEVADTSDIQPSPAKS